MVTGPVKVGEHDLEDLGGLWFLTLHGKPVSTLIDMGDGTWRARTPDGTAQTIHVPDGTDDQVLYVAKKIT